MGQIKTILDNFGLNNIALIILALSIFIDIAPSVKFNPWKWLFGRIGMYINKSIQDELKGFKEDVYKKIDDLKGTQQKEFDEVREEQRKQAETLNNLITDMKYKEISQLRWDIINFETRIKHGDKYPREQYRHIIDEAEKFLRITKHSVSSEGSDNAKNHLIVDPEDIVKIRESLNYIQTHYEQSKTEDPASFLI